MNAKQTKMTGQQIAFAHQIQEHWDADKMATLPVCSAEDLAVSGSGMDRPDYSPAGCVASLGFPRRPAQRQVMIASI
jgi:hypothetical protein